LTNYKNNNRLTSDKKRYLIARKMKYLWEGNLGHAVDVSIAIYHLYNELVYSKIGRGYEYRFHHFMDEHWGTNCTGNTYCDISYKDYMELKSRSEVSNFYFEKKAIHCYELWMQNAIRRVKRAKEIGKKIRAIR
ncbi:1684_t:CDS:1, partial [Racocetra persica]